MPKKMDELNSIAGMMKDCNCSYPHLIASWIIMAIGLFFLVWGFSTQFNAQGNGPMLTILASYFVGFALMFVGKFVKCMGHMNCPAHHHMKL